jgi:hypothetical protein
VFRIAPPATVDWYDVDFPEVIAARRQLLPAPANAHNIGADLIRSRGFDDPREPERWNPRLKLVREILLTREPEVAQFPPALRWFTRLAAHSTAVSRRGTTVLHYRF